MNHTIARRRLGPVYATQNNLDYYRALGRVAALLAPATPEMVREVTTDAGGTCWMPAEVLDALAVTS